MVYLHSGKSYGEDSDVSDGAKVGGDVKALDCGVLHKDRKKS